MPKIVLAILFSGMLLIGAGCGGGNGNKYSNSTNTTGNSLIDSTIRYYFNEYFASQKTENLNNNISMSNILADNENIYLNEKLRSTLKEEAKAFNTGFSEYQYKIKYKNTSITDNTANIDLVLDLDFKYTKSSNRQSGIYGINYQITLKNDGSRWVITQIESDLPRFQSFKEEVERKKAQCSSLKDAIEQVNQEMRTSFQMMQQPLYQQGSSSFTPTSDSFKTKSVYISCKDYNYSADKAVKYALAYAESKNDRLFYTAKKKENPNVEMDCTNFVSQCIWAGYVGFDGNEALAKDKIAKQIGMVRNEWHGGPGGGTGNWENVNKLWDYMTDSSKDAGPRGIGHNNLKPYYNMSVNDINIGDVLQFRRDAG
ncbi:MAG TPA: amidase domain-containing protein, partial [Bacillota bacterium]